MLVVFRSDASVEGKGFRASYTVKDSKCGGVMSGDRGVIMSPNYPNNYDANDDCGWLVQVDTNHVVEFTFEDFDVEPHSNCSYDHVAIYDGNSTDAPLLLMHCGRDLPSPAKIKSSSNQMFVRLKADGSVASKGFKANFTRGCGATIVTEGEGVLTSPDWPHVWSQTRDTCDWVIRGSRDTDRVTLTMTYLQLSNESPSNCSTTQGHIDIRDGEDSDAPLLVRLCGSHAPPPITSQGSSLYVHVSNIDKYYVSAPQQRFRAVYSVEDSACGGHLRSESGRIASPQYPSSYPPGVECVWSLAASSGNLVSVNFEMFNLEASDNCNDDYVDVYQDGPDGQHVGRYCGDDLPNNLTSANKLWIKFNSDSTGTAPGFIAHYNLLHGSSLSGDSGIIESPMYPLLLHYADPFTYHWTITVSPDQLILITFLEFDLEHTYNCYYSYLAVYDGQDDGGNQLFHDCRLDVTGTSRLVTTSNVAYIVLHGDNVQYGVKFRLRWRSVPRRAGLMPASRGSSSSTSSPPCGGSISLDPSGNVTRLVSPGWPASYANNLNCEWIISTDPGNKIKLRINSLNLESSYYGCPYDRLTVFDGMYGTQNWNKTGDYCRRTQRYTLYSSGANMRIVFRTDSSRTRSGFSLSLQSTCGGYLTSSRGYLTSPGYPGQYPANAECDWVVRMRPATQIQFQFIDLDIVSDGTDCAQDYLILRNGERTTSPFFLLNPSQGDNQNGHLCGRQMPQVLLYSSIETGQM